MILGFNAVKRSLFDQVYFSRFYYFKGICFLNNRRDSCRVRINYLATTKLIVINNVYFLKSFTGSDMISVHSFFMYANTQNISDKLVTINVFLQFRLLAYS